MVFYFNNIMVEESLSLVVVVNLVRYIVECLMLFLEILKLLFEIVLFEDCLN